MSCVFAAKNLVCFFSIEYEIYLADRYGAKDVVGNWNGLVGEIVNRLSQKM